MTTNGFIKLHREILDSDYLDNPKLFTTLMAIELLGDFSGENSGIVELGLVEFRTKTRLNKNNYKKYLNELTERGEITWEIIKRNNIKVKILKWGKFQTKTSNGTTAPKKEETPLEATKQPLKEVIDTTVEDNITELLEFYKTLFKMDTLSITKKENREKFELILNSYDKSQIKKILIYSKSEGVKKKKYKLNKEMEDYNGNGEYPQLEETRIPLSTINTKFIDNTKREMEKPVEVKRETTEGFKNKGDINRELYEKELTKMMNGDFGEERVPHTNKMYESLVNKQILKDDKAIKKPFMSYEKFIRIGLRKEYFREVVLKAFETIKYASTIEEHIKEEIKEWRRVR